MKWYLLSVMLLKASFCDMAETEAEYILLALMDAYNAGFLHRDFSPGKHHHWRRRQRATYRLGSVQTFVWRLWER